MSDPTSAPPGWYDDGQGQQRYWDGRQWTEHTAPLEPVAADGATRPYDTAALGGEQSAAAGSPYADTTPFAGMPTGGPTGTGAAPAGYPPGGSGEPPSTNVLGIIGLVVAAVGFVLALIPFVQVIGFVLLPIGFVLSLIAVFMKGRKWPAITGLVVSVVGAIIGAIVFAVVALGVFSQVVDSGVLDEFDDQVTQSEAPLESDGASEGPEDGSDGTGTGEVLSFGETMVWSNDVSMTVSPPEPFAPSDLAAGDDQAQNVVFTITIVNGSAENVQPIVLTRVSSDGVESSRIFDVGAPGGQVGIPPTTAVLPGESITWQEAYSVQDPDSLTLQTAPSFQYEDVVFTNIPQ
ncbi:DUF2510 domain-containing protein [Agromyces sp. SYSU T0242]|uniref:DUF2510 domain-containing protein n=1 Tax=Agromyces litoreus TaxID=3158561 RepID=UPI003392C6A3